jgi:uncharacterized cupin superfamily protein
MFHAAYDIVLQGEIALVLDNTKTVVRAGDIAIQKGTNHASANRSGENWCLDASN